MNLIEGIWFTKVLEFYISSEKFIAYQGKVLFYTGICGIAFAVLSKYLLSHFKWLVSAIITPYIVLTLGTAFFVSILLISYFELYNENHYLYIVVLIGLIQNVLIKGAKYGIYDSVKEMQYIPLDDNIKSRGKAAVDVISSNLGKSLGSLCQFTVFFTFPNVRINDIVIILMAFFLLSSFVWINATYKLSKMIDTKKSLKIEVKTLNENELIN
jgi:ATP/ADP translocase